MIEVVKKFNALEVADVEAYVSEYIGRTANVSEMNVTVFDVLPSDIDDDIEADDFSMQCEISIDGEELVEEAFSDLDVLPRGEAFLDEKYIFAFDTSMFKSYNRVKDIYPTF